jgi:hypothetical protein
MDLRLEGFLSLGEDQEAAAVFFVLFCFVLLDFPISLEGIKSKIMVGSDSLHGCRVVSIC